MESIPMNLAAAFAAGHLAGRATDRLHRTTEAEIREAHERAVARRSVRSGEPVSAARRELTERGRHAAPRLV
ncbi:hypothetical protein PX701_05150 [Agromyces sp. H3Y2-19a]|uniref:hypothetical protein n=1 Tax=Agromyces chromiiresistens TaxID=3030835 RepID=UPI0023B94856|nr:hypothetical protein [Agromyces chromiiresistens]MDF0513003.1 hypothetical protein [Agromyces chromiiresistens]